MKRSPIQRRTPLRASQPAKAELPILRKRKCKGCGESFRPFRALQTACGVECAAKVGRVAAEKAEKKQDRERRQKLKTISDYIEEAQIAFNLYIRLRDAGRGCISCGAPLQPAGVGGGYDCGHWRSRGAAGHLRFHEDNAAGQCKRCNRRLRGNAAAFRIGLVERIGLERVEALEADNQPVKWTKDMLTTIKTVYRAKARQLKKEQAT